MRSEIDSAGAVLIPKRLRDRAGLAGASHVEITVRDGKIEIEAVHSPMSLAGRRGGVVAVLEGNPPRLTDEVVRATVERARR